MAKKNVIVKHNVKIFSTDFFEIVIKRKQQGETGETGGLKKNQPKRVVKIIIRTFWTRL